MTENEMLTKKMKLVHMYEADISTEEKPIIGTQALGPCVGVLLYNEEMKKSIVAHSSVDWQSIINQTLHLVYENGLDSSIIKYKVIPGYYKDHYEVKESLEEVYSSLKNMFIPFNDEEIPTDAIGTDEETTSKYFAFDASTGKFVTNKVLFGKEYLNAIKNEQKTK